MSKQTKATIPTLENGRSNIRHVKKWKRIDDRLRKLDDEVKQLKQQKRDLQPSVLDYFANQGLDKVTIEGTTIYTQRALWAGASGDKNAACEALVAAGLGEFVKETFNTQTLSAHIRELERDWIAAHGNKFPEKLVDILPPELQDVIKISEVFTVRTRQS